MTKCRRGGAGDWPPQRLIENPRRIPQAGGVKLMKLFAPALFAALLAGCQKTEPVAAPEPVQNSVPTHAQPKLPTMKLYLGAETLDAELALTGEQEHVGMMWRTNILETDAMIFVLPFPQRASFWMTNCPESLSAAYIAPDGVIQEIHHLEKNTAVPVVAASDNIQFVLEVKDGWFARHNIAEGAVIRTERGSLAETFLRR
jgi:uncharacterized membrane protein (UPF0127 family)